MTAEPSEPLDLAALRRDWVELPTLGDLIVRRAAHGPETDAIVFPESRETGRRPARRLARHGAIAARARHRARRDGRDPDAEHARLPARALRLRARRREGAARQRPLQGLRARLRARERRRGRRRHHGRGLRLRRLRAAPDRGDGTAPAAPPSPDPARLVLAGRVPRPRRLRGRRRGRGRRRRSAPARVGARPRRRDPDVHVRNDRPPEGLPDHARGARADRDQRRPPLRPHGRRPVLGSAALLPHGRPAPADRHALGGRRVPHHDALRGGPRAAPDRRRAEHVHLPVLPDDHPEPDPPSRLRRRRPLDRPRAARHRARRVAPRGRAALRRPGRHLVRAARKPAA